MGRLWNDAAGDSADVAQAPDYCPRDLVDHNRRQQKNFAVSKLTTPPRRECTKPTATQNALLAPYTERDIRALVIRTPVSHRPGHPLAFPALFASSSHLPLAMVSLATRYLTRVFVYIRQRRAGLTRVKWLRCRPLSSPPPRHPVPFCCFT